MNTKGLTRADLDGQTCQAPGCNCGGEMFLHAVCHPQAGTQAGYLDGTLTVRCGECDRTVARIAVSDAA